MDLPLLASVGKTPTLVVTGGGTSWFPTESLAVFGSPPLRKKDLLLMRKAGLNIDRVGGASITTASPRSW